MKSALCDPFGLVDQLEAKRLRRHRIKTLVDDVNCSPRSLVRILEAEPELRRRVLTIINSSHFAVGRPLPSLRTALAFIGFNTLKRLVSRQVQPERPTARSAKCPAAAADEGRAPRGSARVVRLPASALRGDAMGRGAGAVRLSLADPATQMQVVGQRMH